MFFFLEETRLAKLSSITFLLIGERVKKSAGKQFDLIIYHSFSSCMVDNVEDEHQEDEKQIYTQW